MKPKEQTLTLQEAISQGYTHFCFGHPSDGYQTIDRLSEITQLDIDQGVLYLADKNTFAPSGISHVELKEMIAEHIWINHQDNTGDDTDTIYDAIKEIDFSDVVERIDKKLNEHNTFRWITNIRLI